MEGYREYDILAGNIVLGNYSFLKILLRDEWVVKPSGIPPEIYYTSTNRGYRYVLEGLYTGYLVNSIDNTTLLINISVKRGLAKETIIDKRGEYGEKTVNGHKMIYLLGEEIKGLIRRRKVYYVEASINCSETNRHIKIRLESTDKQSLRDIFRDIGIICHP